MWKSTWPGGEGGELVGTEGTGAEIASAIVFKEEHHHALKVREATWGRDLVGVVKASRDGCRFSVWMTNGAGALGHDGPP